MSGHNGKVLERSQTTGCDVTAVVQRGPVGLGAIRPRAMRRELQLRLALLEADWRHQMGGGAAAALDVLRRCEWRFLGVRYVGVKDAELRFDYDLALWKLCYQTRLEQEFIRRDNRLWQDLARANDRCVVQFLGAFLDLHATFGNEMRRQESCKDPNAPVTVSRVLRPSRIAQLTELRRIEESFLAEYLHEPAKRNLKSHLLLGRLHLTAGLALWRSLTEERKYADELSSMPPAADIRAAVHVKLYQTDSAIDGTKVWSVLNLWSESPEGKVGLELPEQVALASLANYDGEGLDGQPARMSILNVRNYLNQYPLAKPATVGVQ